MSEMPILREARAAVFAAVCVLVAVVGHDAFSPGGIPLWVLALSAALLFAAVRPLTSRERGLPSILGAMAIVQVGLHQVFVTVQQHAAALGTADTMPGMSMNHAVGASHGLPALGAWWCGSKPPAGIETLLTAYPSAMLHAAGIPVVHAPTAATSAPGTAAAATQSTCLGMLAAHVVAALVAAWWLRHGEATAWALTRALATRVMLPLSRLNWLATPTVPWTPPRTARAAFDVPDRPGPGVLIRFIVARRGPPTAAAFC